MDTEMAGMTDTDMGGMGGMTAPTPDASHVPHAPHALYPSWYHGIMASQYHDIMHHRCHQPLAIWLPPSLNQVHLYTGMGVACVACGMWPLHRHGCGMWHVWHVASTQAWEGVWRGVGRKVLAKVGVKQQLRRWLRSTK